MHFPRFSILPVVALLTVLVSGLMPLYAQEEEVPKCEGFLLAGGWSRPALSSGGTGNGAVFGTLINLNAEDDVLLNGTTALAGALEIHESTMTAGNVMQMHPVEGGLVIPGNGGAVTLKPGSFHLMLIGLTQDLPEGATAEVTLNFENAGEITFTVPVQFDPPAGDEPSIIATGDITGCPAFGFYGASATVAPPGDYHIITGILLNLSDTDQQITGAGTPAAELVQFAQIEDTDRDMPTPLPDGVTVSPGGFIMLQWQGIHLAVFGLFGVEPGASFDLYLTVADSDDLMIPVTLTMPEDMGSMHNMDDMHHDSTHDMQANDHHRR